MKEAQGKADQIKPLKFNIDAILELVNTNLK
jgi:hypothetical protein